MPWMVYQIMHFVGITMVLISFGGILLHQMNNKGQPFAHKRLIMVTHGVGMLLILVAGFGLLAKKLGLVGQGWPMWIWIKLGIWLVFGIGVAYVLRSPYLAKLNWFLLIALVGFAAYIANFKPV
jgi:hypothetical protein